MSNLVKAVQALVVAWDKRTEADETALLDLANDVEAGVNGGNWSNSPLGDCSLGATSIPAALIDLL